LLVQQPQQRAIDMTVSAQFRLARNTLFIDSTDLTSGNSHLRVSGLLHDFARPVLDVRVAADLDAAEVARSAGFPELRAGRVMLDANLHRDLVNGYRLTGKLTAHKLAVRSVAYDLPDCDLSAQINAVPKRLDLTSVKFNVPWGQLTGSAILLNSERFSLAGRVNSVKVVSAEKFLFGQTLPWNGVAAGTLNMDGLVGHAFRNFAVETMLDVTPAASGSPLSAHIEANYHQAGETLDLTNSRVDLSHTRLTTSGRVNQQLGFAVDSTDLEDLRPLLSVQGLKLLPNGSAHFDGDLAGPLKNPAVSGAVSLSLFSVGG
jgi:hypothetical protein